MFTLRRTLATLVGTLSAFGHAHSHSVHCLCPAGPVDRRQQPGADATDGGSASHGSPLWVFAVVAMAAAVVTLAAVLATMKLRHASRPEHRARLTR